MKKETGHYLRLQCICVSHSHSQRTCNLPEYYSKHVLLSKANLLVSKPSVVSLANCTHKSKLSPSTEVMQHSVTEIICRSLLLPCQRSGFSSHIKLDYKPLCGCANALGPPGWHIWGLAHPGEKQFCALSLHSTAFCYKPCKASHGIISRKGDRKERKDVPIASCVLLC